ncbi:hypothetical protein PLICRDRAFT_689604 [Plicaturopsis crispa FD-325 SS-3]|nr:hypothetical protein PLICRDRAFT_689604 [Plicaturopsis crispa FD-325 SS-3]
MAPKHSAGKEKLIDDEDEVLQAVILADSFNKRFKPLTSRKPRCLLPICNAPLLDWTFESLALAGVQEIFVICRSHAELVKEAIKNSKWSKPSSGLKIVPIITAKETFSPGDAMRDIYTHGIIKSDFVLVTGDLVSSIQIDEVVRQHKERRKTNKDAIMTIVVKESGASHRTRSRGESSVFVLDAETSECLHYEPVTGYPPTKIARIPREVLAEHPEIEIRNDFIDCSIDVCSVEVPSLFQDNFDYADIRRDFVHGILTSDLLMKNIYCYVAKTGYAARVQDTKSYDSISKDILSRWTFPLVPDDNHPGGHAYEHNRGNRYIAKDNTVVLSRTCKIGNNTLIGSSTQVFDGVQVIASVIGQRCTIGAGSVIRNSYIFDDTTIGPNCFISNSIVGANVHIKEDSRVESGCLVGDDVVVGPHARLAPFERVSKTREKRESAADDDGEESDEDSELEDAERSMCLVQKIDSKTELAILGEGSNATVWPRVSFRGDEDEDDEDVESPSNQRLMRIGDDTSDLELSDPGSVTSDEEDSDSSDGEDSGAIAGSRLGLLDASSTTSLPTSDIPSAEAEFRAEVEQSLARAFAEGHSVDNAAVELKTLRMASNVPLERVREAVVKSIVERIQIVDGGAVPQRQEIARVIGRWGELIHKIGGVDAVETVVVLQNHCASSERMPLFGQILAALYQDDIIEEDDIRAWHDRPESKGEGLKPGDLTDNIKKCWIVGARMIQQFDAQDSDSDEDAEEDAEEEDAAQSDHDVSAKNSDEDGPEGSGEDDSEEEGTEDATEEGSEDGSEEDSVAEEAGAAPEELAVVSATDAPAPPPVHSSSLDDEKGQTVAVPSNEDASEEGSDDGTEEDSIVDEASAPIEEPAVVSATDAPAPPQVQSSSADDAKEKTVAAPSDDEGTEDATSDDGTEEDSVVEEASTPLEEPAVVSATDTPAPPQAQSSSADEAKEETVAAPAPAPEHAAVVPEQAHGTAAAEGSAATPNVDNPVEAERGSAESSEADESEEESEEGTEEDESEEGTEEDSVADAEESRAVGAPEAGISETKEASVPAKEAPAVTPETKGEGSTTVKRDVGIADKHEDIASVIDKFSALALDERKPADAAKGGDANATPGKLAVSEAKPVVAPPKKATVPTTEEDSDGSEDAEDDSAAGTEEGSEEGTEDESGEESYETGEGESEESSEAEDDTPPARVLTQEQPAVTK